MRVRCQPPKKNVLFFLIGPPPNPPYWLRLRKSFSAAKKPFELNVRSRRYSKAPPWNAVRPRARDDVHDGARIVAMRRAVVRRLNRELLECVGEREALVFLEIRVGVVRAVQPVRVLALAGAVGRNADRARNRLAGLLADRRQHRARDQRLQSCHLASGIGSSTMRAWSTTSLMVADEMSTVAASPATVIVSARSPSSSVMFTVRFWFACSVISVRRTVLKPASSARIS